MPQTLLNTPGPLLKSGGSLSQVGWSPQPLLDCNLESARFYTLRWFQRFRIKRWDYYAVFTPGRFFSATIADLGYAGNIFVYTMDLASRELHEEGLIVPFGKGITLPRNSNDGETMFANNQARLCFTALPDMRRITLDWPSFHDGRGIQAELSLSLPPSHESMNIVIPIGARRFYLNRKVNCLPAEGFIKYGEQREELHPETCLGSLDWGRGVWEYRSFWNWASASGFMADGRQVGLNMGMGFGDISRATENCLVLDGRVHKLGAVRFDYDSTNYSKPWRFNDDEGRLALTFTPFKERLAQTNLAVIFSEVHQMFGHYSGRVITDQGESLVIQNLVGFAEEHHARW